MNYETRLPNWDFVAGETQKRSFELVKPSGEEYDFQSGTADLAVIEYVNRGEPVATKKVAVTASQDGLYCEVAFSLSPSDTVDLAGKYLYQITIKDGNGNASIPFQGDMNIAANFHKSALS